MINHQIMIHALNNKTYILPYMIVAKKTTNFS